MSGHINCSYSYGFRPGGLFRFTVVLSFCLVQLSSAQSSREDELELATEIRDQRATTTAQIFWREHSPSNEGAKILQGTSSSLAKITRQTRYPENSLTSVAFRTPEVHITSASTQYSKVRTDRTTELLQRSQSINSKRTLNDSMSGDFLKLFSGHSTVFERHQSRFSLHSTRTLVHSKLSTTREISMLPLDGATVSLKMNAERLQSSHSKKPRQTFQHNVPIPLPSRSTAVNDRASKQLESSQTNLEEPKQKIQSSILEINRTLSPSLPDHATVATDQTSEGPQPSYSKGANYTVQRTTSNLARDVRTSSFHYPTLFTDQKSQQLQPRFSVNSTPTYQRTVSLNSITPSFRSQTVFIDQEAQPHSYNQSTQDFQRSTIEHTTSILSQAHSISRNDETSRLLRPSHSEVSLYSITPSFRRLTMFINQPTKEAQPRSSKRSTQDHSTSMLSQDHSILLSDETPLRTSNSEVSLNSITPSFRRATVFIGHPIKEAQPRSSKQSTQDFQRSILKIEHTTSMLSQDHSILLNNETSRPLRPSHPGGPTQRFQGRVSASNSNEFFIPLLSETPMQRRPSHSERSTLVSPSSSSDTSGSFSIQSFGKLTQFSSKNSMRLPPSHLTESGQNASHHRFNINQGGSSASVFGHSTVLNNHSKQSYASHSIQTTLQFQRVGLKFPSRFSLPLPDHSTLLANQTEEESHPSNFHMESTQKVRNSTLKTDQDLSIPLRNPIIALSSSYLPSTTLPTSALKVKSSIEEQNRLPPIRHHTVFPGSLFTVTSMIVLPNTSRVVSFTDTATVLTLTEAFAQVHHTPMSLKTTVLDNSQKSMNNINVSSAKPTKITNVAQSEGMEGVVLILVAAVLPGMVVFCMLCCFINNKVSSVLERRSRVAAERARALERKCHSSQASLLSAWTSRDFFLGHMPAKESKLKETISVDLSWPPEGSDSSARNEEDSSITVYKDGDLVSGNPEGSLSTSERSVVESCKKYNRNKSSSNEHILFNIGNGNSIKSPGERRTSGASDSCMVNEGRVTTQVCKLPPITQNVRLADSSSSISNILIAEGANDKDHFGEQLIPMLPIRKSTEECTGEERRNAVTEKGLKQLDDSVRVNSECHSNATNALLKSGLALAHKQKHRHKQVKASEHKHKSIRRRSVDKVPRFNKLTSGFHASVLLLIMNFVITLSK